MQYEFQQYCGSTASKQDRRVVLLNCCKWGEDNVDKQACTRLKNSGREGREIFEVDSIAMHDIEYWSNREIKGSAMVHQIFGMQLPHVIAITLITEILLNLFLKQITVISRQITSKATL
jgi:hypothetical protein